MRLTRQKRDTDNDRFEDDTDEVGDGGLRKANIQESRDNDTVVGSNILNRNMEDDRPFRGQADDRPLKRGKDNDRFDDDTDDVGGGDIRKANIEERGDAEKLIGVVGEDTKVLSGPYIDHADQTITSTNDVLPLENDNDQLIEQARHSTLPSLIIAEFINGATPTSSHLGELAEFAGTQYDYYRSIGVINPDVGPYEALAVVFSETAQFTARFGEASDESFIANTYLDAFGRAATTSQIAHFQQQIDYFEGLHEGADPAVSGIRARGAVVGQMLGYAATQPGNDFADAASAFILDAAKGSANFGTSLMGMYVLE